MTAIKSPYGSWCKVLRIDIKFFYVICEGESFVVHSIFYFICRGSYVHQHSFIGWQMYIKIQCSKNHDQAIPDKKNQ